ncbi:hypothetical protein SCUCBS95973_001377 [Sporothrix curviconia]|uniref:Uncharacterized protein n=1 Tax=Sporothrix curviconia TaxID=1260050 RepID=A0ABP0AY70_9PEZI
MPKKNKGKAKGKGKAKAKGKQAASLPSVPALPPLDPKLLLLDFNKDIYVAGAGSSKLPFFPFGQDSVICECDGHGNNDGDENAPITDSASTAAGPVRVQAIGKARKPHITLGSKVAEWAAALDMPAVASALESRSTNAAGPSARAAITAATATTAREAPKPLKARTPVPSTVPPPQTIAEGLARVRQLCAIDNPATDTKKYHVSHGRFCDALLEQEGVDLIEMAPVKTIAGRGDLYIALANDAKVAEVLRVSSERLGSLSDYFREPIDILRRERGQAARVHKQNQQNKNAPTLKQLLAALYADYDEAEAEHDGADAGDESTDPAGETGEGERAVEGDVLLPSDAGLYDLECFIGKTICINYLCPAEIPPVALDVSAVELFKQMIKFRSRVTDSPLCQPLQDMQDSFLAYHKIDLAELTALDEPDGEATGFNRFPEPDLPKAQPIARTYTPPARYKKLPHGGPLRIGCQDCESNGLPLPAINAPRFGLFPAQVAKYHYTYTDDARLRLPMYASEVEDSEHNATGTFTGLEGDDEKHDDGSFAAYPVPITGMIRIELGPGDGAALRVQQLAMLLHAVHGHPDTVPEALSTDAFWHLLHFAERLGLRQAIVPFVNAWRATLAAHNPAPAISPATTDMEYIDSAVVAKLCVGFAVGCPKTVQDAMRYVAWHMTAGRDGNGVLRVRLPLSPDIGLETAKS